MRPRKEPAPRKRSVALYQRDDDGVDRCIVASSEPEVVEAVEKAIARRVERSPKRTDDPEDLQ